MLCVTCPRAFDALHAVDASLTAKLLKLARTCNNLVLARVMSGSHKSVPPQKYQDPEFYLALVVSRQQPRALLQQSSFVKYSENVAKLVAMATSSQKLEAQRLHDAAKAAYAIQLNAFLATGNSKSTK